MGIFNCFLTFYRYKNQSQNNSCCYCFIDFCPWDHVQYVCTLFCWVFSEIMKKNLHVLRFLRSFCMFTVQNKVIVHAVTRPWNMWFLYIMHFCSSCASYNQVWNVTVWGISVNERYIICTIFCTVTLMPLCFYFSIFSELCTCTIV